MNTLSQADLASRLTINCASSRVKTSSMRELSTVTIMDVFDEYAICSPVREEIYQFYPYAKLAQLKSGGNFPYLSRYEEVNLHIKVRNVFKKSNLQLNAYFVKFYSSLVDPFKKI